MCRHTTSNSTAPSTIATYSRRQLPVYRPKRIACPINSISAKDDQNRSRKIKFEVISGGLTD